MNYKKVALLLLFSAIVLAGCLDWLNPPAKDEYEIFSNIPTDNAKALVYMKFTEDGNKEFQELFGTLITGKSLKDSKGSEAAVAVYNDSLGFVSYSKTNMSVNDAIERMNSSMDEKTRRQTKIETKSIGGKDVTVVSISTGSYEVPICVWKDGDTLKVLMTFGLPKNTPYVPSPAFADNAESPLLGYALQSVYSGQNNFGNTCETVIGKKYDTGNVRAMFNETDYIKKSIPISGKLFGEVKIYAGNNELINGSGYMALFGDDNADNLVAAGRADIAKTPVLQQTGNYCFSTGSSNEKSTIVESNGKEACMKETTIKLISTTQLITLQRKVGEYYIGVITYVKDNANTARENAKNIVFSVNLPGSDASWTDKGKLEVKVYSGSYGSRQPLAGARVDLLMGVYYAYDYSIIDDVGPSTPKNELIKTLYTDDSGNAVFENLLMNESLYIVASKEGYENQSQSVYSFTSPIDIYMTKVDKNLRVTVYYYSTESGGGVKVKEAKVKVYSGSVLLGTNYTDKDGEATIQNVENGRVRIEVSKEGYEDEVKTVDVSRYSRDPFVYVTPRSNMSALANGTMNGADHLCAQITASSLQYKIRAKFTSINDSYSRYLMYGVDCPDASEIGRGCSTTGCGSGGRYCYIATASSSYTNSGIVINTTVGKHTICIWPSSPRGYNWFGQIYGEG
ncbi:hypothetical protein H0N98_02925 [Candidatus Micrarchaeota archaeon]|nr:hypothetical protein [Candidatus Micrarchaeota archaeon]